MKNRLGRCWMPALLLLVATSVEILRAEPSYHYFGVVIDEKGRPVPKAQVEYYALRMFDSTASANVKQGELFTDKEGRFDFQTASYGIFLLAKAPNFAPAWTSIIAPVDREWRLMMHPATSISGVVLDTNKQPIAGVEVWCAFIVDPQAASGGHFWESTLTGVIAQRLFSTRSLADGSFRIGGIPTNGLTLLAARKSGLASPSTSSTSESWFGGGASAPAGQKNVKVLVEPTGSIAGQVTVGSTGPRVTFEMTNGVRKFITIPGERGTPVGNARIILKPQDETWTETQRVAQADSEGNFHFDDVAAGHFLLCGSADSAATPGFLILDDFSYVHSGEAVTNLLLKAVASGFLTVRVMSKEDGRPLPGARVEFGHETYPCDKDGTCSFEVPAGECGGLVRNEYEHYQDGGFHVHVIAQQTSRVDVTMSPLPKLQGKVITSTGKPVVRAEVMAFIQQPTPDFQTQSRNDGSFELPWNRNYDRQLRLGSGIIARAPKDDLAGFAPLTGGTNVQVVRVLPALAIAGSVSNQQGEPIEGARIRVSFRSTPFPTEIDRREFSDKAGHFEIRALPAGFGYLINAFANGYQGSQREVPATKSNRVTLEPMVMIKQSGN